MSGAVSSLAGRLRTWLTVLLLGAALLPASGQCELKRLWAITEIAPQLATFWPDVERVDFNDRLAVFSRRDRSRCVILSCPEYQTLAGRLTIIYAPGDTLALDLRERGCRILDAYRAGTDLQEKLFVLVAAPDDQCDFALNTVGCGGRRGGPPVPVDTIPRRKPEPPDDSWICRWCPSCWGCPEPATPERTGRSGTQPPVIIPSGPNPPRDCTPPFPFIEPCSAVPVWLQYVFIFLYAFYLISFLVLWGMGRTRQRNYCWGMLTVLSGLYSPLGFLPLTAFAVHLSFVVLHLLRWFRPLNVLGRLFFYGVYTGLFVIYEMVVRFGVEQAAGPDFVYFSVVPPLLFVIGLRLCGDVIGTAWRMGYGGWLFYAFLIGILYFGPYIYVSTSRAEIIGWVMGWGVF